MILLFSSLRVSLFWNHAVRPQVGDSAVARSRLVGWPIVLTAQVARVWRFVLFFPLRPRFIRALFRSSCDDVHWRSRRCRELHSALSWSLLFFYFSSLFSLLHYSRLTFVDVALHCRSIVGVLVHVQARHWNFSSFLQRCYSSQNGVAYLCCDTLTIINGVCTCSDGPCTQCSPSAKDKQKVLPLSPFKKPSVPAASLPSCNGCFQGDGNVNYACCDNQVINNGVCTCTDGPCTQCSPSVNDKPKVQTPIIKATGKPTDLPSCDCGDISLKGAHYTCCGSLSLNNNICSCDGGPCTQCSPSEPFKPMILDSCSCNTMQLRKVYYSCCGTMSTINNICTCDGSPCTPCSPSENTVLA